MIFFFFFFLHPFEYAGTGDFDHAALRKRIRNSVEGLLRSRFRSKHGQRRRSSGAWSERAVCKAGIVEAPALLGFQQT